VAKGEGVDTTPGGACGGYRRDGPQPGSAFGPMQGQALPSLPALGDWVVWSMVACKDHLFHRGNDLVHDGERSKLSLALCNHRAWYTEGGRTITTSNICGAVTCPIGQQVTICHHVTFIHVGRDPRDNYIGALDQTPQVTIGAFSPMMRHRAAAEAFETLLEVEAISDDFKIAGACCKPNQG
jgi:hypothetical protein